jgi:hypothetical protein
MKILDMHGRLLSSTTYKMDEGYNLLTVDFVGLSSGKYYVHLSNKEVNQTLMVVKR